MDVPPPRLCPRLLCAVALSPISSSDSIEASHQQREIWGLSRLFSKWILLPAQRPSRVLMATGSDSSASLNISVLSLHCLLSICHVSSSFCSYYCVPSLCGSAFICLHLLCSLLCRAAAAAASSPALIHVDFILFPRDNTNSRDLFGLVVLISFFHHSSLFSSPLSPPPPPPPPGPNRSRLQDMLANLREGEEPPMQPPPVTPPSRPSVPRLNEQEMGRPEDGNRPVS